MVSLSKFESLIAPSLDISKPVLDKRNRELKKAGLLPGGAEEGKNAPRGMNAPQVSAKDMVNVILAAVCAKTPKETPEAVRKLASMKSEESESEFSWEFGDTLLSVLTDSQEKDYERSIQIFPNVGKAEIIVWGINPSGDREYVHSVAFQSDDYDPEKEESSAVLSYNIPEGLLKKVRDQIENEDGEE